MAWAASRARSLSVLARTAGPHLFLQVLPQVLQSGCLAIGDDGGAATLAQTLIRVSDDGYLADPVMLGEQVLDLDRDVLATAHDDVLASAGNPPALKPAKPSSTTSPARLAV
jgi:hypothetical protein